MNNDPLTHYFYRIPHEMRAYRSFIMWKYEAQQYGKPTKVPYQAITGRLASVTNPNHWCLFNEAIAAVDRYDGIGFVFSSLDPYAGIDLDDTEGDASITRRQIEPYKEFNSYSERSPSGKGLHIISKGNVPSGRKRNKVEVYSSGRFFTMTGDVYNDKPIAERQDQLTKLWDELSEGKSPAPVTLLNVKSSVEDDNSIIERALKSANGGKFRALWNGDGSILQSDDKSGSAIDQELVNIIQFHTKDPSQIERIWLSSPQGRRDKTRRRKDYRNRTIARAFDNEIPLVPIAGFKPPGILSKRGEFERGR